MSTASKENTTNSLKRKIVDENNTENVPAKKRKLEATVPLQDVTNGTTTELDEEEEEEIEDNIKEEEDETYGLQSEVSQEPINPEAEKEEAIVLAKELGLTSTDEATSRIGHTKALQSWCERYTEMLGGKPEDEKWEELTQHVSKLDSALNDGIRKIMDEISEGNSKMLSDDCLDLCKVIVQKYCHKITTMALALTNLRSKSAKGGSMIFCRDILEALKMAGRKMYWSKPVFYVVSSSSSMDVEDDDEVEDDIEDDDDEEEEEEIPKTEENDDEDEDEGFHFAPSSIATLIENALPVDNEGELTCNIEDHAVAALQASIEDLIFDVLQNAMTLTKYAEKEHVEGSDIKIVLRLWNQSPGGSSSLIKALQF